MEFYQSLVEKLANLELLGNKRHLPEQTADYASLVNLSSNDYLGLSQAIELQQEFLDSLDANIPLFSSSSSRLLTGNYPIFTELENYLCDLFQSSAAIVFNNGFNMNLGIISAISDRHTLILSDELNHASMIDGIRLAKKAQLIKYKHNDLLELEKIITQYQYQFATILIVTESIFSMDGDICDLLALIKLKQKFPQVVLYVDEAHAIGVRGLNGLGYAEEQACISEIDFLVGTFGKAIYSVGGYVICNKIAKEYLINCMRPFIFSTAMPPINIAWTLFILKHLSSWKDKRSYLQDISDFLRQELMNKGYELISASHIIPIILGDNRRVIEKSQHLKAQGFYILPIRSPTVSKGTERLRISLHANIKQEALERLLSLL